MRRKKELAFLISFLIIPLVSATILVKVNVKEVIDGNIAYLTFQKELNNSPQHILLDWENQGSVGCRVRFRVDFYNGSEKEPVYTAWSKEKALEPGDHAPFEIFFYPRKSGNYSGKFFVYFCNLIKEVKSINFTAFMEEEVNITKENVTKKIIQSKEKEVPFEITKIKTTKGYVEFKISSQENISNLAFIPNKYPPGWIFESGKIEKIKKGEEKKLKISYSPSIWKEEEIGFDVVTLDGKYHTIAYITLQREKKGLSLEQKIIGVLIFIILILVALIFIMWRDKRKRKKKEGIKD